jgi:hypothetical protein
LKIIPFTVHTVFLLFKTEHNRLLYFTTDGRSVSMSWYLVASRTRVLDTKTYWLGIAQGCSIPSQYVWVSGRKSHKGDRAPLCDLRLDITSWRNIAVWNLWSSFRGAPALTRGRVCNL